MKNVRIGLRLHIFLAFLIVFLISFAVIIVTFNLVVQSYINKDATEKIEQSIQLARNLAADKNSHLSLRLNENDTDIIVNTIVRTLSGSSDVNVALISSKYQILFPTASDSVSLKNATDDLLSEIQESNMQLGNASVHVLEIGEASYYTSSVPIVVHPFGGDSSEEIMYLLLYLDASPYLIFLESINQILLAILFVTLLLTLLTSLLVSNSIIRSIHKLTQFASRIGAGFFERQELKLFDKELDILASDMNGMADKLEKSDKEQKMFFQNASHELRTPLMSIQGYAEGIRYKVFDDQESAADVIISESKRLSGMVQNLLTISRLDTAAAGRLHTPKHMIDMNELLASVVDKVRGSALLGNKKIVVHLYEDDIYVLGNENDLFRAFENILSNGIRYADSAIHLSITKTSSDWAEIQIMDDGRGIQSDIMPRLFDRFTRGIDGKHGIGLAIVKSIIADHDGNVSASNRTDSTSGAVFTVSLRIAPTDISN